MQTATDATSAPRTCIETTEVDQTTFTSFDTTYPEGPVYWRVQAVDGSGNGLDWSDTGVFDKKSPAPVLAVAGRTADRPRRPVLLVEPRCRSPRQYRIEVYKNHDTAANAVNLAFPAATIQSRMVSLTGLLPQLPRCPTGTTLVWRVRRIDAAGRTGAWSDWRHFRVVEPCRDPDLAADSALGRAV